MKDDSALNPVTGAEVPVPDDAEDVINTMRGELDGALAGLKLFSSDDKTRAPRPWPPWIMIRPNRACR